MADHSNVDKSYGFEVLDEWNDPDTLETSEVNSKDIPDFEEPLSSRKPKPTEGEIDAFLENVKELVNCETSNLLGLKSSKPDHTSRHSEKSKNRYSVQPISSNIKSSKSTVLYKPGGTLSKTIFNELSLKETSVVSHAQKLPSHSQLNDVETEGNLRKSTVGSNRPDQDVNSRNNIANLNFSESSANISSKNDIIRERNDLQHESSIGRKRDKRLKSNESTEVLRRSISKYPRRSRSRSRYYSRSNRSGSRDESRSNSSRNRDVSRSNSLRNRDVSRRSRSLSRGALKNNSSRSGGMSRNSASRSSGMSRNRRSRSGGSSRNRRSRSGGSSRNRRSRSGDRSRHTRSKSRDKRDRKAAIMTANNKYNYFSPSKNRSFSISLNSTGSPMYPDSRSMASHIPPSFPEGAGYSMTNPPSWNMPNMGGAGMQQFMGGNMPMGSMVKYPNYEVMPPGNVPYGTSPQQPASYSVPPPAPYPMSSLGGFPSQETFPGTSFTPNENFSKLQGGSWNVPPPYITEPPPMPTPSPCGSGNVSSNVGMSWSEPPKYPPFQKDPLKDVRRDGRLDKTYSTSISNSRSRSRSKSKDSKSKSRKKKSKRYSKSPDSRYLKSRKKHRHSISPDYNSHADKKSRMIIDPDRIPTPPPPPILRGLHQPHKASEKSEVEEAGHTENIKTVSQKDVSLSSLLEAVMETSGVGKSQVNNPKVKKEILSNCETKIQQLYKKRISGLGAFIPDPVEARLVNSRCSPLITFHPHLSFNEGPASSVWRCPGIIVPKVKLINQESIRPLTKPLEAIELKPETKPASEINKSASNSANVSGATHRPITSDLPVGVPAPVGPSSKFDALPVGALPVEPPVVKPLMQSTVPPLNPGPLTVGAPYNPVGAPTWQGYDAMNPMGAYPNSSSTSNSWPSQMNYGPPTWQSNNNQLPPSYFSSYNPNIQPILPYNQPSNMLSYPQHSSYMKNTLSPTKITGSMSKNEVKNVSYPLDAYHSGRKSDNLRNIGRERSPQYEKRRSSPSPTSMRSRSRERELYNPNKLPYSPTHPKPPIYQPKPKKSSTLTDQSYLRNLAVLVPISVDFGSPKNNDSKSINTVSNSMSDKSKNEEPIIIEDSSKEDFVNKVDETAEKNDRQLRNSRRTDRLDKEYKYQDERNFSKLHHKDSDHRRSVSSNEPRHDERLSRSRRSPDRNSRQLKSSNKVDERYLKRKTVLAETKSNDLVKKNDKDYRSSSSIRQSCVEASKSLGNSPSVIRVSSDEDEYEPLSDRNVATTNSGNQSNDELLTFSKICCLGQSIRNIQEKSILYEGIIDCLQKGDQVYRRLYTFRNEILCKLEYGSHSKNMKIIVPRDNIKEFIVLLHKEFHDVSEDKLFKCIRDHVYPPFLHVNKKISAVFSECAECKLTQPVLKGKSISELKLDQKSPPKFNGKQTKRSNSNKKNSNENIYLIKRNVKHDSVRYQGRKDVRREESQSATVGRPSGYEKAIRSKSVSTGIITAPSQNVQLKINEGNTNEKILASPLSSSEEDLKLRSNTSNVKDQGILLVNDKLNECEIQVNNKNANKSETPNLNDGSSINPQENQMSVSDLNKKNESETFMGSKEDSEDKQNTERQKSGNSGLDFKTRIRNVQIKNNELLEIITAVESKEKGKVDESYLLKGGMLCKKGTTIGSTDVRIVTTPSNVEEMIEIVHTMSAIHTPSVKVVAFFSKHFSPVEDLENLVKTYIGKCQQCVK